MLFPHLGHSTLTVGKVRNFCSSFPIIAMDSWGERSIVLGTTDGLSPVCFVYPHFGHMRLKTVFFAVLLRRETSRIPQSGQNSTQFTSSSAHVGLQFTLLNLFFLTS